MLEAYEIKYIKPPSNSHTALLKFSAPKRRLGFIPRDYGVSAEKQAENLARATKGFISFARVVGSQTNWVYTVEGKNND